jgi:site-specific DNA recombinase
VRRVVRRVVVHPDRIEAEISKRELRAVLAGDPREASRQDSCDVVRLALEARIKRCGGEIRLVVPPDLTGQVPAHPVPSLLKALARGRQWYEWVVAGEVSGRRSIAHRVGFDERHVSQILECAFLAPDIVEAILDGRQPPDLTWRRLTRRLPLNWAEQRKRLGFESLAPRAIGPVS